MKILVINGPNLNLLGQREPGLYGAETLTAINEKLRTQAQALKVQIDFVQSNHEGDLIDYVQKIETEYDAGILNAAGYTHTSVALRDSVLAISKPVIEVHLTNPAAREDFRQKSFLAGAALGSISGFGAASYELALYYLAFLARK